MSQTKARPDMRTVAVIDFICDVCKKPLDGTVLIEVGAVRRIKNSYHTACWKSQVKPHTQLRSN